MGVGYEKSLKRSHGFASPSIQPPVVKSWRLVIIVCSYNFKITTKTQIFFSKYYKSGKYRTSTNYNILQINNLMPTKLF